MATPAPQKLRITPGPKDSRTEPFFPLLFGYQCTHSHVIRQKLVRKRKVFVPKGSENFDLQRNASEEKLAAFPIQLRLACHFV